MAMSVIGLALYLMALGKWGKSLKAKNTPIGRKRLYGASVNLIWPLLIFSFGPTLW